MLKKYKFDGYNTDTDLSDLDEEITFVEKGTPCGELLRRYWHPVLLSEELGELPKLIKVLGEELVLFRDKSAISHIVQLKTIQKSCFPAKHNSQIILSPNIDSESIFVSQH